MIILGWGGGGGGRAGGSRARQLEVVHVSETLCYAVHASKNTSSRDLNQKIRDYIYSFVWRNNVAKDARLKELGKLAKTCK